MVAGGGEPRQVALGVDGDAPWDVADRHGVTVLLHLQLLELGELGAPGLEGQAATAPVHPAVLAGALHLEQGVQGWTVVWTITSIRLPLLT